MSGLTILEIGDEVPLGLQIADGAEDQYPQAEIYDNDGNNLTTVTLDHAGDGLYQPSSPYTMPSEIFIQAVYIVYGDSGHVTESSKYLRDVDAFASIDPDDYKADVPAGLTSQGYTVGRAVLLDNLDATISSVNTAIAALNDIDTTDVQAAMTSQGYTIIRAALLDNLDVAISDIETLLEDTIGLVGENVVWSGMTFDSENNLTAATITQYTDNTVTIIRKAWDLTATYNVDSELTAYSLVEQ